MKKSYKAKTVMTFALALSVISGCGYGGDGNQALETPDTKKVIHSNNGYITGEPVAYKTEENYVTGNPVSYQQSRKYYRIEGRAAAIPDTRMNVNPNFDQNTGMLYKKPEANQAQPAPQAPAAPETAQQAPAKQPPAQSAVPGDKMIEQVVQLTNEQRRKNGMGDLKVDVPLANMAQEKAQDMLDNGYFSHTSPTYGSPFDMMKAFGISYRSAGENIAKGQQSAQQVVNDWMNSPGHRANILNSNFTHIGVGHTTKEGYWAQEFITK
jgi:uncharacterized YkwD family protein